MGRLSMECEHAKAATDGSVGQSRRRSPSRAAGLLEIPLQERPPVIIAIWRAHDRMRMVAGRLGVVERNYALVDELDEAHGNMNAVIKGALVVAWTDTGEARFGKVALH